MSKAPADEPEQVNGIAAINELIANLERLVNDAPAKAARIESLEAALRERTAERDYARRNTEATRESRDRIQEQRDQLIAEIYAPGSKPPGIVPVMVAVRIARETREERDALQKRIDAARDRVRFVADSDDRDKLAAILEGRTPEQPAHPAIGWWKCARCGDAHEFNDAQTIPGWAWSSSGPGRWMHSCAPGRGGGAHWCERIGDAETPDKEPKV